MGAGMASVGVTGKVRCQSKRARSGYNLVSYGLRSLFLKLTNWVERKFDPSKKHGDNDLKNPDDEAKQQLRRLDIPYLENESTKAYAADVADFCMHGKDIPSLESNSSEAEFA